MTFNFSAGPGVLPKPVLLQVQNELLNYKDTGSSVMEISHRSKEFQECIDQATSEFKALYDIPSNYKIIFMQGGATSQFSAVCYNLITDASQPVDYFVTGVWSDKAAIEAKRLGANVNVVFNSKASKHNGDIPADPSNLKWSANPAYIYYCDNETVHGVEMPLDWIDRLPHQKVPIICDMSSNFLSRPIDVKKFGVIFGGAQKNVGPAGVTIVIVREDLLGRFEKCPFAGPLMFDYKTCADSGSMYNTPPCFSIYVSGLVFKWLLGLGGLQKMNEINKRKSDMLYRALSNYPSVYMFPVVNAMYRSRMNVPFRILNNGVPDEAKEKLFLKGAEKLGCVSLAGHRSVGGIRASLYNALDIEAVETLVRFIKAFASQ